MAKQASSPKKTRCEECGGTGLRADEVTGTAICSCPAGSARERANNDPSLWD